MKSLILDTSTDHSYFLIADKKKLLFCSLIKENKPSTTFVQKIKKFFKEKKISLHDLNYLAVSLGPGSFTGIRVACSIASALSYALRLPLLTYCHLNLYIPTHDYEGEFYSALDAKTGGLYLLKGYQQKGKISFDKRPIQLSLLDCQKKDFTLLLSPHEKSLKKKLPNHKLINCRPTYFWLIDNLYCRFQKKDFTPCEQIAPFYLKSIEE